VNRSSKVIGNYNYIINNVVINYQANAVEGLVTIVKGNRTFSAPCNLVYQFDDIYRIYISEFKVSIFVEVHWNHNNTVTSMKVLNVIDARKQVLTKFDLSK